MRVCSGVRYKELEHLSVRGLSTFGKETARAAILDVDTVSKAKKMRGKGRAVDSLSCAIPCLSVARPFGHGEGYPKASSKLCKRDTHP